MCAILFAFGCGAPNTPILGCDSSTSMAVQCGFQNPEDMVVDPWGGGLVVSQMGSMDGSSPGNLLWLGLPDGHREVVFPVAHDDQRVWGARDCPPPDPAAFAPHGVDLEQRADGRWMLAAVNHGLRESVELFELIQTGEGVALEWRGCALGPENAYFNDVVLRRDGGFWVTHMMPRDGGTWAMVQSLFGRDLGFVYQWHHQLGFSKVRGSRGAFPNGLEKSADEQFLFVNLYMDNEVRKLDLSSGRVVASAAMASPDNSSWSDSGQLLVASQTSGLLGMMSCQDVPEGNCGNPYQIVALDSDDLSQRTLLDHRGGAPMGGVTVALEHDARLYLGTFAGDRIGTIAVEK